MTATTIAGTNSQITPAALCEPSVAAAPTASGSAALGPGACRNATTSAATRTSSIASAISLIPPQSA